MLWFASAQRAQRIQSCGQRGPARHM